MSTDSVAADREAMSEIVERTITEAPEVLETGAAANWKVADLIVDRLIAAGLLRDAAAVRHEHGERIARWAEKKAQQSRDRANFTDRMSQHKHDEAVGEARAYAACARLLRSDAEHPPP